MVKRIPAALLVVVLAIGLTATAAFAAAGHPASAPHVAAATVPPVNVGDEAPPTTGDKDEATETDGDKDEATETPDATETDGEKDEAPTAHPTNHGAIVSVAAQATTPAGCKNHGQYVSMVARGLIDPNATPPEVQPGQTPPSVCATPTPAAPAAAAPKHHGKPAPKAKQTSRPD